MPKFTINASRKGPIFTADGIKVPVFSTEDMTHIGEAAIEQMKHRSGDEQDVFDAPAPPLKPKYAKQKARKGLAGVRDLRYSGNMLGSMQILEVDKQHCKVGFKGSTPYRKAIFNQNIDPFFGLSTTDEEHLMEHTIRPLFHQNIEDALK